MPIKKSAKKELRKNKKRREKNLFWKIRIKALEKRLKKVFTEKERGEAQELLSRYYKLVDKAVKEGIIKKNKGRRKKSEWARKINLALRDKV